MKYSGMFIRWWVLLALAVLSACALPPAAGLANTQWQVTSLNNGGELVSTLEHSDRLTLAFDGAGRASGQSGCNRFSAAYAESGNQLIVSQVAGTRMMCVQPEGIMQREAWILAALASVASWRIEGDVLTLKSATGTTALSLRRASP